MKKKIFLPLLILFLFGSNSIAQVKFKPEVYIQGGHENNIFKSPNKLLDQTGTYYPEKDIILSDQFIDYGYDLDVKYKPLRKHKFLVEQNFWGRNYSDNSSLNQWDIKFEVQYEYSLSKKMDIGIEYDLNRAKKIGTSVLGTELTRKFSYLKHDVTAYYQWKILKNTQLELEGSYYVKMYEETTGIAPLNHKNTGMGVTLEQDLSISDYETTLWLEFHWDDKKFTDIIASDVSGRELEGYPLRHWQYYNFSLSWKLYELGNFTFKPFVDIEKREDLFQDYYTYNALDAGIKLYFETQRIYTTIEPAYSITDYKTKKAPDPDGPDPLLTYKYFTMDWTFEYKLSQGVSLNAKYQSKDRNTNTLDESRKTRRPYNYYEMLFGLTLRPGAFFKN